MSQTRLIYVGGFLGAGKTTALMQLGRALQAQGRSVGLLSNDQSDHLVDTALFRQAFDETHEIAGGCFCCRFPNMLSALQAAVSSSGPDVILCEPVGSCTDLIATVLTPLQRHHQQFSIAPLSVLIDPQRARALLLESQNTSQNTGMPADTAYIWLKQLEEADVLVVNKSDLLTPEAQTQLRQALEARYQRPVLFVSALTGADMADWLRMIGQETLSGGHWLREIDYDRYAHGEAVLGWLNASGHITGDAPIDLNALAQALVSGFRDVCDAERVDVAHFKTVLQANGQLIRAQLTGQQVGFSSSPLPLAQSAQVIINARVPLSPERLKAMVTQVIDQTAKTFACQIAIDNLQAISPGYPTPTYRLNS